MQGMLNIQRDGSKARAQIVQLSDQRNFGKHVVKLHNVRQKYFKLENNEQGISSRELHRINMSLREHLRQIDKCFSNTSLQISEGSCEIIHWARTFLIPVPEIKAC